MIIIFIISLTVSPPPRCGRRLPWHLSEPGEHGYNIESIHTLHIYIYTYMLSIYIYCVYIYGPVSRVPTPPHGMGGGMMPLWWCIYIHTYLHTYLPTYLRTYIHTITLPYLTLPYLTLHYLTLHSIHTYIPLHYITLPYITLPYLTLPYLTFHTYIHT